MREERMCKAATEFIDGNGINSLESLRKNGRVKLL
jgi:hypothetical protein